LKNRILACVVTLSMAAVMFPMVISAATTTVITASLNDPPSVATVTPSSGAQGNSHKMVAIVGTYFTGTTIVSFGAGITVNSFTVDADNTITADISIDSGATIGVRNVSVTTPGGTATKTGGFTVAAPSISVSAPSNFSLGALVRGGANTMQAPDGLVTTNSDNWQVTATGSTSHGGKMWNGSASPTALLQFSKDGSLWDTADSTLTYTQAGGTTLSLWVQQPIDADDPVGNYSITITFTGSVQ
jgi:hypothetical protein